MACFVARDDQDSADDETQITQLAIGLYWKSETLSQVTSLPYTISYY